MEQSSREIFGDRDIDVIKIGGENAGDIEANVGMAMQRLKEGITPVLVVSAIRSTQEEDSQFTVEGVQNGPGFNTTSHCIALGEVLELCSKNPTSENMAKAEEIVKAIKSFHERYVKDIIKTNLMAFKKNTQQIRDASQERGTEDIRIRLQDKIKQADQSLIEMTEQSLYGDVTDVLSSIEAKRFSTFSENGVDRLAFFRSKKDEKYGAYGRYFTFTGFGELLSTDLYLDHEQKMHPLTNQWDVLEPGFKRLLVGDFNLQEHMQPGSTAFGRSIQSIIDSPEQIHVVPGYLPSNMRSRGYSDVTAVDFATGLASHGKRVSIHVAKQSPIRSGDPRSMSNTQVVKNLSLREATELFGTSGANAGALHPDAVAKLHGTNIPTYIYNPTKLDDGVTHVSETPTTSPKPKIVSVKPLGQIISVESPIMADREGVLTRVTELLKEANVSDVFTDEGKITLTFTKPIEKSVMQDLEEELLELLGNSVDVKASGDFSTIYLLGEGVDAIKTFVNTANCLPEDSDIRHVTLNEGIGVKIVLHSKIALDIAKKIHAVLFPSASGYGASQHT